MYNGWANYETWNVYVWLSSDYETCKICERAEFTETGMKNFCTEFFGAETPDNAKLKNVNWKEVSEAFEE